jgi:hypothetical protein
MDYLAGTGQSYPYWETQIKAADAILVAWRAGVRHRIRLANVGIVAVQQAIGARASIKQGEVHLDALRDLTMPGGLL